MGLRQDNLLALFRDAGFPCKAGRPVICPADIAAAHRTTEVARVYASLGGCLESVPLNPGPWDIVAAGVPVELDEERHFNRYRAVTLQSDIYPIGVAFDLTLYRRLCADREQECLRSAGYGGYWTNPSCEMMFGRASAPKVLDKRGPARWKQRAWNDFLKDIRGVIDNRPVVRFSIWETIGDTPLGLLLEANTPGTWRGAVVDQFNQRASLL